MKTVIQIFACALALLIPLSSTAMMDKKGSKKSTGFGTGIYPTKEGKINVYIDKISQDFPTTILLKNQFGDVLYRETISRDQQKFGRRLNIDQLEPGKYEIKIMVKGESQSTSFKLSEQKVDRVVKVE